MGVTVISGGGPVTLSGRLFSWNASLQAIGSTAGAVSDLGVEDLRNPMYVWRTQRSVRTVVGFIANNIAQVPLYAYERDEIRDQVWLDPADSLLAATVAAPHPKVTPFEFMHELVIDRCLWNRYAALKVSDGDRPMLVRLMPQRWKFIRDVAGLPVSVQWNRVDGSTVDYPLDVLLWFDGYRIGQEYTPMDAIFDLLTEQTESGKYRTNLWQKGGRFGGWIERPPDAPVWSTPAKTNFKTGWQKFASGGGREGETPILEDGMKYHENQHGVTPETAQQLETRKLSIAEVASAFYLPPVFAGLLDNANYSNVTVYRDLLYSDVLGPDFTAIAQGYNSRVVPDVADSPDEFVEFAIDDKLRMGFEDQLKAYQTATGGPIMTRNEARRRIPGLGRHPDGDELIVPLNVTAGGQASPTDSVPPGR